MKRINIFLADGFEEVEAFTVVDILRRAGARIDMVSVTKDLAVRSSHGVEVKADKLFEEADRDADLLVLPGGMPGTLSLKAHEGLAGLLKEFYGEGKYIAAICAAPTVFGSLGFLEGRRATCYPSMEDGLIGAEKVTDPVVADGNVITSRGVGTAIPFALVLVEILLGKNKAEEVKQAIVF